MSEHTDFLRVAILPGDGIGRDLIDSTRDVFDALDVPVDLRFGRIGWDCWCEEGTTVPQETWELIEQCDTALLGAVTNKPPDAAERELTGALQGRGLDYVSSLGQIQRRYGLAVKVRPILDLRSHDPAIDYCIVYENSGLKGRLDLGTIPEGLADAFRQQNSGGAEDLRRAACTTLIDTRDGLLRLYRYAFELARSRGSSHVTLADKPNLLKASGMFRREVLEEVAQEYPNIEYGVVARDTVALWMLTRPERFGVIIMDPDMGDVLSSAGAATVGGVGMVPSASVGEQWAFFEPMHGSAPHMYGRDVANPCATFLTIAMLFSHHGFDAAARQIQRAVVQTLREGNCVTPDLGGNAGTRAMSDAILRRCVS